MNLKLQREPSTANSTPGKLYVDAIYQCFMLEDPVRETPRKEGQSLEDWVASWKIPGKTAIPAGRYEVQVTRSERFSKKAGHEVLTPQLMNVPGFSGIRIHPGTTALDTEGCPLPGSFRPDLDHVTGSRVAYDGLLQKIKDGLSRGKVFIDVVNPA